ncbi:hypothetical protein E2C01_032704 [Portunus trituberculatus]|uniref:Uncharacterized protein n=1 Tax=Portunus trituberculatus TaxID=210409 RepID=A0A5B7F1R9_PORTR|nr:hypothetical protein [Portunus trituberculatus]
MSITCIYSTFLLINRSGFTAPTSLRHIISSCRFVRSPQLRQEIAQTTAREHDIQGAIRGTLTPREEQTASYSE